MVVRIHRFAVTLLVVALAGVVALGWPRPAVAGPITPILYRIFLDGGGTLTSYGDFTRVGERVVLSLPVGPVVRGLAGHPTQLVSIPAARVDWALTERYADAARYAHYAATRGEADYAALSVEVAHALNAIARHAEPSRALTLARVTRQRLVDWSRRSYGYRAEDIHQIVSLLDEAISGLSGATGESSYALSFVAVAAPPFRVPLAPPPDLRVVVEQALTAAALTPVPEERLSVLRTVVSLLSDDTGAERLSADWVRDTRQVARDTLEIELDIERAYADLTGWSLARADDRAADADVRGVRAVVDDVHARDRKLGHARPDRMTALLHRLDRSRDAAERLQLARDRWRTDVARYWAYRDAVASSLDLFRGRRSSLDDIRLLAGPDPDRLEDARRDLDAAWRRLVGLGAPPALEPVHELYVRALTLARHAADLRQVAVRQGDLDAARNASAAASGGLLLFERAGERLAAALAPPELDAVLP